MSEEYCPPCFTFSKMKNQRTTFTLLLTVLALVDIFCILTFLGLISAATYIYPDTAGFDFSRLFRCESLGRLGDKPRSADYLGLLLVPDEERDVNPGVISHHCYFS